MTRPAATDRADDAGDAYADDRAAIAGIVDTFFAAFTSGPDSGARLDALRALFVPGALVVKTCGDQVVYDVDGFIEPRRTLLAGGRLTDFSEWALPGRTDVFGDIAQHVCEYAKSGVDAGTPFTGRGMKVLQFVRTAEGWRITSAAWDDERAGVAIDRPAERCGNAG